MIKTIMYNVLSAFGQAFGFSFLLAVLFMFFYMQCRQDGLKSTLTKWIREFKEKKDFRKVILLALYVALVLFRTLFNRKHSNMSAYHKENPHSNGLSRYILRIVH